MAEQFIFDIDNDSAGERTDVFLAGRLGGVTRSYVQKLLLQGQIVLEGKEAPAKNYRLREGDRLLVTLPDPELLEVKAENIPLDIVYEDDDLLVINKPQGMVVHPAPGNESGTLVNALMYHCGEQLSSINGVIRPGIVHRIDKDTSGLLAVAKTDRAHTGLAEQFAEHSIVRAYRAIVYHNIKEEEGTVDRHIGRDVRDRLKMAVVSPDKGRRAVTHYRVLARSASGSASFTYVECRLETGRTHQIRVHMASIGHPLLGDPVYGPKKPAFGIREQVLHAKELGFIHPVTGERMFFDSPLPESFLAALKKTGIKEDA